MNARLQVSLPDLIPEPKTAKQKLKNDTIGFLRERDCQWQVAEVTSSGNSLVTALTERAHWSCYISSTLLLLTPLQFHYQEMWQLTMFNM